MARATEPLYEVIPYFKGEEGPARHTRLIASNFSEDISRFEQVEQVLSTVGARDFSMRLLRSNESPSETRILENRKPVLIGDLGMKATISLLQ